jgi:hypothetical protein
MANWQRIVGGAALIVACGLQIGHGLISIRRGDFLIATSHEIGEVEAKKRQLRDLPREQYAEAMLDLERESRQIYMRQANALNGYFLDQSWLMLASWVSLFAVGMFLNWTSRRQPSAATPSPQPPEPTTASLLTSGSGERSC